MDQGWVLTKSRKYRLCKSMLEVVWLASFSVPLIGQNFEKKTKTNRVRQREKHCTCADDTLVWVIGLVLDSCLLKFERYSMHEANLILIKI